MDGKSKEEANDINREDIMQECGLSGLNIVDLYTCGDCVKIKFRK